MTGDQSVEGRQLGKEFRVFPKGNGKALKGFKQGSALGRFASSGCRVETGLSGKAVN